MQSLQLLDMNVYNNVFVGEQNGQGKKGAGTAISSAPRAEHIWMQPLVVRAACREAGRRGSHGTRTHSRAATQIDPSLSLVCLLVTLQTACYVYQVLRSIGSRRWAT